MVLTNGRSWFKTAVFPVETSEGLFLVRAASNCLQRLTAITMKDLKLFYMHKYDYFLSKNIVNWL